MRHFELPAPAPAPAPASAPAPALALALALALAIVLVACTESTEAPTATPDSPQSSSEYLRKTDARRVVVFIHGVLGDARATWTASNGSYFPKMILTDPAFDQFDVFVYDYPSPLYATSYTIDELADNLRLNLDDARIFADYEEVVFVCHSMGGLVARAYLLKYQARAEKVPMIYFYSTPSTGAEVSNLAKSILPRNPQFKDMQVWREDAYVGNLVRQWLAAEFELDSYCAYEIRDTYGVRVVEQRSATNLCTKRLDPIDANHITIVKPPDRGHASYLALRQAVLATPPRSSALSPLDAKVTLDGGTYGLEELLGIIGGGIPATVVLGEGLTSRLKGVTVSLPPLRGVSLKFALDRMMADLGISPMYHVEGALVIIEEKEP